eukprot:3743233-Prymnesium_polylepis.1
MREPSGVWRARSNVRSATGMLPAARRGTAACPPSIRRFQARRAAQRHVPCTHKERSTEDRRIDGGMKTVMWCMPSTARRARSCIPSREPGQVAAKQQRPFPPENVDGNG